MNTPPFKKQILSPSGQPDSLICCACPAIAYKATADYPGFAVYVYSFTPEALQMNESNL